MPFKLQNPYLWDIWYRFMLANFLKGANYVLFYKIKYQSQVSPEYICEV